MVSVTLDVAASAPVANAQAKAARQDSSASTDSFAALIDSPPPADVTSGPPTTPEPPQAQANSQPQTGSAPSAPATESGTTSSSPSNDPADAPDQPAETSTAARDPAGNTTIPPATKAVSGKPSDDKSSPDKAPKKAATDAAQSEPTASLPSTQPAVVAATQAPAASLIVNAAPAGNPASSAEISDSNAPLAIAASAIAASSSIVATLGAAAGQIKPSLTASAGTATTSGQLPVIKGQTRAATGLGTGQPQPFETQGELVTDVALAPETGAAPTLTEKTASPRTSTGLQARASTPSPANSTTTATSLSPTAPPTADGSTAPLPVAVQKQTVDPSPDDPVKTDKPDGPHSTSAAPASHDVISSASVAQPQPSGVDASIQSAMLPQQLGPTPQPTPSSTWVVTVATGVPVPVSGLAVEIAASAQSGKTRFEVRLDPADLGRIDVRIDVNRDGQVTSHLIAEKPETLSMLQQDAPQLQQALNDAGLKTGSGGLQFSLRDQSSFGGQNNGNQMQGNAQRLILSDETSVPPAAVAGQSYGRMLGLSGGVDIRV